MERRGEATGGEHCLAPGSASRHLAPTGTALQAPNLCRAHGQGLGPMPLGRHCHTGGFPFSPGGIFTPKPTLLPSLQGLNKNIPKGHLPRGGHAHVSTQNEGLPGQSSTPTHTQDTSPQHLQRQRGKRGLGSLRPRNPQADCHLQPPLQVGHPQAGGRARAPAPASA